MTTHQERSAAKRTRITVDVTPELRRRIKIAAAERDTSVRAYVVNILDQVVPTEAGKGSNRGTPVIEEMIRRLRETREAIMRGRTFTDDSADLIREGREERDAELERDTRG